MDQPLVTIITPVVPARRKVFLERCRPSVLGQTYPNVEHMVVSDGPWSGDPIDALTVELGRNWRQFTKGASYGAIPRAVGTYLASGSIIGYLDDDDEFLPDHVAKHVEFIQRHNLMFSYSIFKRFWSDGREPDLIGSRIEYGQIGTPCVMHKAECLRYANWGMNGYGEDFMLFDAWAKAGLANMQLPEVTIHVHKQV